MLMKNSPKLLIVEDDEDLLLSLSVTFESMGCETLKALNGEEALKIVLNENISAVLCDIQMPKMTGIEFLDELRARNIHLPVIMMTGYSQYEDEDIDHRGGLVVLRKPFSRSQIREIVDEYIRVPEAA